MRVPVAPRIKVRVGCVRRVVVEGDGERVRARCDRGRCRADDCRTRGIILGGDDRVVELAAVCEAVVEAQPVDDHAGVTADGAARGTVAGDGDRGVVDDWYKVAGELLAVEGHLSAPTDGRG